MFRDILVGSSEADENLTLVWQAVYVNRCQDGNIRGLHVLQGTENQEEGQNNLEDRFNAILFETAVQGKFFTVAGNVSKTVPLRVC